MRRTCWSSRAGLAKPDKLDYFCISNISHKSWLTKWYVPTSGATLDQAVARVLELPTGRGRAVGRIRPRPDRVCLGAALRDHSQRSGSTRHWDLPPAT